MGITEKNEKQEQTTSGSGQEQTDKKSYQPPRLLEYGNVAFLTQARMFGSFADGGNVGMMTMMMMP
ncbi:MAG: hypothetical protein JMDDDDMK_01803 [Acidobacteria bacterium]|nr:hypothetical protein [Acidobacteriota bacterium]